MAETAVTLNQHALSDVACVEIVTEDEKSYTFVTASEVGIDRKSTRLNSSHPSSSRMPSSA